ncbi:UNVERIFIED_CONTAM: hypothetical protein FKN15_011939 [Acipenser sinensis]
MATRSKAQLTAAETTRQQCHKEGSRQAAVMSVSRGWRSATHTEGQCVIRISRNEEVRAETRSQCISGRRPEGGAVEPAMTVNNNRALPQHPQVRCHGGVCTYEGERDDGTSSILGLDFLRYTGSQLDLCTRSLHFPGGPALALAYPGGPA